MLSSPRRYPLRTLAIPQKLLSHSQQLLGFQLPEATPRQRIVSNHLINASSASSNSTHSHTLVCTVGRKPESWLLEPDFCKDLWTAVRATNHRYSHYLSQQDIRSFEPSELLPTLAGNLTPGDFLPLTFELQSAFFFVYLFKYAVLLGRDTTNRAGSSAFFSWLCSLVLCTGPLVPRHKASQIRKAATSP